MLINGAKPSCAHHFFNERGMKFCQNRQILWKKNEISKSYRVCYDDSFNEKISDLKTLSVTNPLIRYEILFIITHEKKSGARRELTVTSWWAHCEFTVIKMQIRDLAVSSPRSKCSPLQFVFSWDFHTDPVLHASSFAPFGTDFDHLLQNPSATNTK